MRTLTNPPGAWREPTTTTGERHAAELQRRRGSTELTGKPLGRRTDRRDIPGASYRELHETTPATVPSDVPSSWSLHPHAHPRGSLACRRLRVWWGAYHATGQRSQPGGPAAGAGRRIVVRFNDAGIGRAR